MARLLVSVRNVSDAEAALAGGADLIDIKEPAHGPLGRATNSVIEQIIDVVAGRVPVSAACGELKANSIELPSGLSFAKFGLAGWRSQSWIDALQAIPLPNGCGRVAVAYADGQSCDAPPPDEIAEAAIENRLAAFLIDTHEKYSSTLLDVLPIQTVAELTRRCQRADVPVALAGSLGIPEIERLRGIEPDWFAVRGAVCEGGRGGTVCVERTRDLRRLLDGVIPSAAEESTRHVKGRQIPRCARND